MPRKTKAKGRAARTCCTQRAGWPLARQAKSATSTVADRQVPGGESPDGQARYHLEIVMWLTAQSHSVRRLRRRQANETGGRIEAAAALPPHRITRSRDRRGTARTP